MSRRWAEVVSELIHHQISDMVRSSNSATSVCDKELIYLCRASNPRTLPSEARSVLKHVELASEENIKTESSSQSVTLFSRQIFSDCRLLHSLLDLRDPDSINNSSETTWERAITRLDMAIIVAGAPGEGRLDLALEAIKIIQKEYLPMKEITRTVSKSLRSDISSLQVAVESVTPNDIPRVSPPSLSAFQQISSSPFILSGFINDWPALTNHSWKSRSYLLRVAGRARVVPVEIGKDYRAEEWSQEMIPWEEFLKGIGMNSNVHDAENQNRNHDQDNISEKRIMYLAQHTLLTQFPALRSDIIVPDYVYSSLKPPATFPSYRPPGNSDQLVINAWLGPKGTVSPAHTDPYYNCYSQVVGHKTVWLAAPQFQNEMYPFSNPLAPHTARDTPAPEYSIDSATPCVPPPTSPSLSNSSRVDVFSRTSQAKPFPLFESSVRPNALCAVLQPGDMLFIPPGWWHAMRSEDISFSVSMWF
ncbi:Clavaminate synthase-like protein [Ramaria rubella]|nr:Clavaminate synthase-like protein [Ramaria rubella]